MRAVAALVVLTAMSGIFAVSPALAQQKTVKACVQEWRANKAQNHQANGVTEKAYVQQCRTDANAASAPAPSTPTQTSRPGMPSRLTTGLAPVGNEFQSEAQAKARCSAGTAVWVNLKSHIYHFEGSKNFGTTKSGAYMCEQDANAAGMRAAKNEKHP